tara:strand:+ start:1760 stop:4159 length:2400 start_codon:yes stop_codon:yes gene_type:complete
MKNNFFLFIFIYFFHFSLIAENISIESKNILLEKKNEISVFENDVVVKTYDGNTINSDYAKFNKKTGILILKKNILAVDKENNIIETQYAEYNEKTKIFRSKGSTKITTSEKYIINGQDILLDNNRKYIRSDKRAEVSDKDNNKVFLDNFEYQTKNNIFKSIGFVKLEDKTGNVYNFSQIYIDTKKKEILGTDIKAFMNNEDFKINEKNKPRIFANNLKLDSEKSIFKKSVFTLCDYRKKDKCPPWEIQASQMLHDSKKKTIYYDNAVVKIYNLPIFYIPKLSHPDPTVERRSGFLPPSFSDSKNLGSGVSVPYFWALNDDKNLTFTNKFYISENPLFLGEYQQAFKNSNLFSDFGYTEGYKKNNTKKAKGEKSHFFTKFTKNFINEEENESILNLSVQNVSNDKYLKLYKIDSTLVDYNTSTLENSIDFIHENENIFFGFNASVFETLNEDYNDKYEYILPEITIDKNLLSNNTVGTLDLQSIYKVHSYDTNKLSNFLVNNFDWRYKDIYHSSGIKSEFLGNFKNINYETKNINLYKKDTTSEFYGALGYLAKLDLQKNLGNSKHLFTPKMLLRYSPGEMRKELNGFRLNPINAFSIDRLNDNNNFETGSTGTLGFDYEIKKNNRNFNFSVAQIINDRENKKMPSKSSLDEKLSDLTGSFGYNINNNFNLNYNFSLDQNYNDLNYNEVSTSFNLNALKVDFNYLHEKEHIGNQEYFKTRIDYERGENGLLSLEAKRNLVTNSAEFYNLSYEYINDCLRAGLVYRREFYNDSEIEPENSLMFKITLTPFGDINTPSFNK